MSKSTVEFNRWSSVMKTTWTFQVFCKYNDELNQMIWSNVATKKLTYKTLGENGAKWTDLCSKHIEFDVPKEEAVFKSLKEWSNSHNQFENWVNLNGLLAISSNFETYLSTIIALSIQSDPGLLFNSSKSIDGIVLLKKNAHKSKFQDDIIVGVTKGDWNSRLSAFKKIFGSAPVVFEKNISELEKIRNLRNKIGHAFGRDIEGSRNHEVKDIVKIENLSNQSFKKYQQIILDVVRGIDHFLLNNHIGEFQAIAFFHRIFKELKKDEHQSIRAIMLKKQLGNFGDVSGKLFCKGLVKYYEEI